MDNDQLPKEAERWSLPRSGEIRRSEYDGPVVVSELGFGGRTIRLVRPLNPDLLLDDPTVIDWNRHDDYMPYWAYLWPAAYLLAERVACEPWVDGPEAHGRADVLEIGCGLGLAGLVAVASGLRVQFSDYDDAPLGFVVRSAVENGFDPDRYSIRRLDWRKVPDEQHAIILGADVLYETRLVPLVVGLLVRLLAPGGVALLASPDRVAARGFPTAVARAGLSCRAEAATARSEDGQNIEGTIYRVTRELPASTSI